MTNSDEDEREWRGPRDLTDEEEAEAIFELADKIDSLLEGGRVQRFIAVSAMAYLIYEQGAEHPSEEGRSAFMNLVWEECFKMRMPQDN